MQKKQYSDQTRKKAVLQCFSIHKNVLKTSVKNELDVAIVTNPTPTPRR